MPSATNTTVKAMRLKDTRLRSWIVPSRRSGHGIADEGERNLKGFVKSPLHSKWYFCRRLFHDVHAHPLRGHIQSTVHLHETAGHAVS